ncbi:MAG: hypothetical protein ACRDKF_00130 [Actinomycetota bacterium]
MPDQISDDVYQRVGDELGDLLRHANGWAERTRNEAEMEAAEVTNRAAETAERVIGEAEKSAATLRTEAETAAATLRSEAESAAATLQSQAERAAARLKEEAETAATRVKADAEQLAERTIKEAEARVAELQEAEADARQRIDTLKRRLLTVVEELGEEASDALELANQGEGDETQEGSSDTPDHLLDEDGEDEPLVLDSEEIATGGRTDER